MRRQLEDLIMVAVGQDTEFANLAPWRLMFRLAAISAVMVVCLIPLQTAVFLLSPPPQTVLEYFELFDRSPFLGLLDLDLLLSVDYLVMIPLYLSLYLVLRLRSASTALLGLVLGLFSVGLFLVSREGTFSMWMLSGQYSAATDPEQRAALVASGQMLLTLYNGSTFGLSYLLGGASTLLFSWSMWRHGVFGKAPGALGIITGITMLVPPNTGTVGLYLSLLSLIPTAIWLILLARAFHRTRRDLPNTANNHG